jgi:hypothetical protein
MFKESIGVTVESGQTLALSIVAQAKAVPSVPAHAVTSAYTVTSVDTLPTLRLGCVDAGSMPVSTTAYTMDLHLGNMRQGVLRGEPTNKWYDFKQEENTPVSTLQSALRTAGFYPVGEIDGVFGYRTLSAVRLFQEYVRNFEGKNDIGIPDGVAGSKTYEHMERWIKNNLRSRWTTISPASPSPEYTNWLQLLGKVKDHYMVKKDQKDIQMVNAYTKATDTLKADEWDFATDKVHLIGVRRKETLVSSARVPDDLFILLINGMVFTFWGSTDPNEQEAGTTKEAFLLRGQHQYRLAWHSIGEKTWKKSYRAFRPRKHGVLLVRDLDDSDALTSADYDAAKDKADKSTIVNIHWSGIGTYNFSGGCQVIAGRSYIGYLGKLVDCTEYAARNNGALSAKKTRAAYNAFVDLVTVFSQELHNWDGDILYYTLIYESDLTLLPGIEATFAADTVASLKKDPGETPAPGATIS